MTVKELIDVSPFCNLVEVVIREKGYGRWIQGYRVGKEAKLYPLNISEEIKEQFHLNTYLRQVPLKPGQEVDCFEGGKLPIKVICKDVTKIPDSIGALTVSSVLPRHVPQFHKEALTHNDFMYDINCYPDGFIPEPEKKEKPQGIQLEGQMEITDFLSK